MILNLTAGSGSKAGGGGGTLRVDAPAGVTVTVSKDGETYTQTSDAQGMTVFSDLSGGIWAVTISNGVQISEAQTVKVVTDYSCMITFFAATIAVTYPVDGICTCTKGSIVLTAPDQSGTVTFTVPEAGVWEVACVDGSGENTCRQTVTIGNQGDMVSAVLRYDVYLFDVSPISSDVTGGWQGVAIKRDAATSAVPTAPTVTQNSDHVYLSFVNTGSAKSGIYRTAKKIDLTHVQWIEFTGMLKTTASTDLATRACLSCWTDMGTYWNTNVSARIGVEVGNGVTGTYRLDVSKLTGSHYVGFSMHSFYSTIRIYQLKLLYCV